MQTEQSSAQTALRNYAKYAPYVMQQTFLLRQSSALNVEQVYDQHRKN